MYGAHPTFVLASATVAQPEVTASRLTGLDVVARFRAGKVAVKGVLVGDVMKRTRGQADAKRVGALLDELLAQG